MCWYEQTVYECRDWKWGNCKQRCDREYRMGETCGSRFIHETIRVQGKCNDCQKIETKERRMRDQYAKVQRWKAERINPASIEKAEDTIRTLYQEIQELQAIRQRKANQLGARGELSSYGGQQAAYGTQQAAYANQQSAYGGQYQAAYSSHYPTSPYAYYGYRT